MLEPGDSSRISAVSGVIYLSISSPTEGGIRVVLILNLLKTFLQYFTPGPGIIHNQDMVTTFEKCVQGVAYCGEARWKEPCCKACSSSLVKCSLGKQPVSAVCRAVIEPLSSQTHIFITVKQECGALIYRRVDGGQPLHFQGICSPVMADNF